MTSRAATVLRLSHARASLDSYRRLQAQAVGSLADRFQTKVDALLSAERALLVAVVDGRR